MLTYFMRKKEWMWSCYFLSFVAWIGLCRLLIDLPDFPDEFGPHDFCFLGRLYPDFDTIIFDTKNNDFNVISNLNSGR